MASLKLHYVTLGTPRRDASHAIVNGVLLLHGTAGSAADFARAAFFDALTAPGAWCTDFHDTRRGHSSPGYGPDHHEKTTAEQLAAA